MTQIRYRPEIYRSKTLNYQGDDRRFVLLLFIYNALQFVALILLWPLILLIVAAKKKYGARMVNRLGFNLPALKSDDNVRLKTFWLHALSVGEVTSAVPLLSRLRAEWPDSRIVVTVTTRSGESLARQTLSATVDHILPSPLDLRITLNHYIKLIKPDLYIHVETDFWPNLLTMLKARSIPTLLVNGRISQKSLDSYKKFSFFFKPVFQSFTNLCMQTAKDKENLESLGVPSDDIKTLGNLKFDTPVQNRPPAKEILHILPQDRPVLTAGSTHPGEEGTILNAYLRLKALYPETLLVIVPRKVERAQEIAELAAKRGLSHLLRSENITAGEHDLLIVDTIGELVDIYRHSALAFVGGSLVPQGGHNPIEPALFAIPVLFGPHMEDFSEIASLLLASGGSFTVRDENDFFEIARELLGNREHMVHTGRLSLAAVEQQQGVVDKHISLIRSLL